MSGKKALLIGCNYKNTPNQLQGCINDIIQWWSLLQDVYGFEEKDIILLRDDKSDLKPTKQRILSELTTLINSNPSSFCIVYSGHGTSLKDTNADEKDGLDECIVPCDYQTAGIVRDDEFNAIIKNNKSNGIAIFDCCRSGTVLDLPNEGILTTTAPATQTTILNKIICISGCKDNQDSAEVYNLTNMLPQGALTISMISALRKLKYYPTIQGLINSINTDLKTAGLPQEPLITSSYSLYTDTLFPLIPTYIPSQQLQDTQQLQRLSSQVVTLTQQNNSILQQNNNLTQQNNTLRNQNINITTQLTNMTSKYNTLVIQANSLRAQIASLNTQIASLNNQLNILRKR